MKKKNTASGLSRYTKPILIVLSALLVIALMLKFTWNGSDPKPAPQPFNPPFVKEGTLAFYSQSKKDTITVIDIEIAEGDEETSLGLMFRRTMLDSQGMLFIFQNEEERQFWMKNTYIPLDILYVNREHQIVSIKTNTSPLSEELIPSGKNSQYVIEVVAGFCRRYGVKTGDFVRWARLSPS